MIQNAKKFIYDDSDIHKVYTQARELPKDTVDLWVNAIAAKISGHIEAILDLGCGGGRFCVPLSNRFNAKVYGVDPSAKMLSIAREKEHKSYQIEYLLGSGENIPLEDRTVSLVFMSMMYHHIEDLAKTTSEIGRVLKPRGYVAIRNATKEDIMQDEIFNFFLSAKEIELQRMPYEKEVISNFQAHGFRLVDNTTIDQIFADNHLEFYEKVRQRGLSVLRMVSDSDFEDGLRKFKHYCETKPTNDKVYERFHLFTFQKEK